MGAGLATPATTCDRNGLPALDLEVWSAPPLNGAAMDERRSGRRHCMSAHDPQVMAVVYLPVIAFAAVLIATTIPGTLRHQLRAEPR
jgi:hypothetical protein